MKVAIIVAVGVDNAIGANNKLTWRITEDMAYFKKMTTGNTVIMGRKTFESIGRPLVNRKNIVISRTKHWQAKGIVKVNSITMALAEAKRYNKPTFIIGGASIYKQMIEACDELHITQVYELVEGADTFFPPIPNSFEIDSVRIGKGSNILFTIYKKR